MIGTTYSTLRVSLRLSPLDYLQESSRRELELFHGLECPVRQWHHVSYYM